MRFPSEYGGIDFGNETWNGQTDGRVVSSDWAPRRRILYRVVAVRNGGDTFLDDASNKSSKNRVPSLECVCRNIFILMCIKHNFPGNSRKTLRAVEWFLFKKKKGVEIIIIIFFFFVFIRKNRTILRVWNIVLCCTLTTVSFKKKSA